MRDIQSREGVVHFRVLGKREKIRFIPVNPKAQRLIEDYLAMAGHREALNGALFRPVKNNRTARSSGRSMRTRYTATSFATTGAKRALPSR